MIYDLNFPVYAGRMIRLTAVLGILAALVSLYWGWQYSAGAAAGALFQIAFLSFLRAKYIKWTKAGRAPDEIGTRLVGFTGARLFLEIGACIIAALLIKLAVLGFLAGLLSLTVATVLDKIISVIKE